MPAFIFGHDSIGHSPELRPIVEALAALFGIRGR
jgi:hypothetical protein